MLTSQEYARAVRVLPFLQRAGADLQREFQQVTSYVRVPAGREVFVEGDPVERIALLVSGVVRVYKIGETGREITLYRFGLGESCVLSANAIFSRQTFPAIAVVEQEAEAVMIPADTFRDWVRRDDLWRDFVFALFSQRLLAVMEVIDQVVFQRMDRRVATFLLNRARMDNPLRITHHEIASELGSSREVISRLMDDFINQGVLRAGRGVIEVLDFAALEGRAVN